MHGSAWGTWGKHSPPCVTAVKHLRVVLFPSHSHLLPPPLSSSSALTSSGFTFRGASELARLATCPLLSTCPTLPACQATLPRTECLVFATGAVSMLSVPSHIIFLHSISHPAYLPLIPTILSSPTLSSARCSLQLSSYPATSSLPSPALSVSHPYSPCLSSHLISSPLLSSSCPPAAQAPIYAAAASRVPP